MTNPKKAIDSNRSGERTTIGAVGRILCGFGAAMLLILPQVRSAFALPILPLQVSTNPGNGDQNPYGVAFVPFGFPDDTAQPGDVLVSNFNNGANLQGTGTTIINIRPDRTHALFAGGLTRD